MKGIGWVGQLGFFLGGALVHVVFLRWYAHTAYTSVEPPPFLGNVLLVTAVAVVGGASVWFCFCSFTRQTLEADSVNCWLLMIKGALYGAFATFAALDFLFYLMALYMVLALPREYAGHGLSNFGISIVEIQTYGLDPLLRGMLLGFAYGAFAGAVLYFLRRLRAPLPVLVSKETRLKRAALATSVIGLLSFPFLIPACVFSVLAIVFGMRAVAKQKLSEGRSSKTTYVAIAIGAVGFLATVAFTVASVLYVKPYR